MASNRPHTWKDEQQFQRNFIPLDVEKILLDLLAELGTEKYLSWCDAFVPDRGDWQQVKRMAVSTLEEIQASHERL